MYISNTPLSLGDGACAGSMFGLGLSIFAVFFLGLLATLISHDYP